MWFWYGILTALISAVSVILNKKALHKVSAPLVSWSLFSLSIPLLIPLALVNGLPSFNSIAIFAAVVSSFVFVLSKTFTLDSIQKSVLSHIYPLNSFGTLFQYLFGIFLLSEKLSLFSFIGMLCVIGGSYILKIDEAKEDFLKPFKLLIKNKASLIFLLATILGSSSGILDKIAAINVVPSNPVLIVLFENVIMTILLTAYLQKKDSQWIGELKRNFWILFVGGMLYTALAIVFIYGSLAGPVVLVGSVKKIEALFVLLLSWILLKDKPTKHVWLGTCVMLLGIIIIKLT